MKRINTSDIVYKQIKDDFISNKISFGQKINEIELAKQYNVSRTPLREAIKKFEIEGIIIRQMNGRLKMVTITKDNMDELFRVRLALENMLLKHAINDKEFLNKLHDNIENSKSYVENNNFNDARNEISKFTNIIYQHVTLDVTRNLLKSYNILISKIKSSTLSSPNRIKQALQEHQSIHDALANNDIDLACNLNEKHLHGAYQEITSQFFE